MALDAKAALSAGCTSSVNTQFTYVQRATSKKHNVLLIEDQPTHTQLFTPAIHTTRGDSWDYSPAYPLPQKDQPLTAFLLSPDLLHPTIQAPHIINSTVTGLMLQQYSGSHCATESFSPPPLDTDTSSIEIPNAPNSHTAKLTTPLHPGILLEYEADPMITLDIEYNENTVAMDFQSPSLHYITETSYKRLSGNPELQQPISTSCDLRDAVQPAITQDSFLSWQLSETRGITSSTLNATPRIGMSQAIDWVRCAYYNTFYTGNISQLATDNPWDFDQNVVLQAITAISNSTHGVTLRCPHLSCSSRKLFVRQCDLDKHYRLHFRRYFCRVPTCDNSRASCHQDTQRTQIGFPTAKDRNRHENGHNPSLPCYICRRLFARQDNLRDHCRRRH